MYAIVEMKGQQFRVEAGKKLFINRMNELEKGATVEFENVLLLDNEGKVKVGAPYVKGAKVVCEVLDNECRGDKILVFHKKRRKGFRKLNGCAFFELVHAVDEQFLASFYSKLLAFHFYNCVHCILIWAFSFQNSAFRIQLSDVFF